MYFSEVETRRVYLIDLVAGKLVAHMELLDTVTIVALRYSSKRDRLLITYQYLIIDDETNEDDGGFHIGFLYYTADLSAVCYPICDECYQLEEDAVFYHVYLLDDLDYLLIMSMRVLDDDELFSKEFEMIGVDLSMLGNQTLYELDPTRTVISVCPMYYTKVFAERGEPGVAYIIYTPGSKYFMYGLPGEPYVVPIHRKIQDFRPRLWFDASTIRPYVLCKEQPLSYYRDYSRPVELLHFSSKRKTVGLIDFKNGAARYMVQYSVDSNCEDIFFDNMNQTLYMTIGSSPQSLVSCDVSKLFRAWTPHGHRRLLRHYRRAIATLFMIYRFVPEAMPLPLEMLYHVFQFMT